ncbi:hypothetical protein AAHS21_21155 [Mycobacterium sp. 050272]|uniref:hypothetical protein n=1 Tax=Mycobacterium sp. 050272 TaxID=3142488 RepID=UPI00318B6B31
MVNVNSKAESLKRVREAQNKANEARLECERQNVDDAASFLVELGRLAAVDEWEHNRILEVRAEGERRRHEHRLAGAAALACMQGRGVTLAAIAELAGWRPSTVRAGVEVGAPPDAGLSLRSSRHRRLCRSPLCTSLVLTDMSIISGDANGNWRRNGATIQRGFAARLPDHCQNKGLPIIHDG